jgi:hypothetical protein
VLANGVETKAMDAATIDKKSNSSVAASN